MSIKVLKPGMLSTFQDLGRYGSQHLGIPVAGAMDPVAHRLANLLVGNETDHATLEITLAGPLLCFESPCCIALTGAELGATLNGRPLPLNRPAAVRAGDLLAFGARGSGTRAYLAVRGGWLLDGMMGSDSTYLRSGFGGFRGRALAKGDCVPLRRPARLDDAAMQALHQALWQQRIYLPAALGVGSARPAGQAIEPARPGAGARRRVRVLPGMQWEDFSQASRQAFLSEPFRITPQSERMGYRLKGPTLALAQPSQLLSEAISFGTIQVPAGGDPIVLMADRQTTGGYPKIAQVAQVDLPVLAQLGPGDTIEFEAIALARAQQLDLQREQAFARLHQSLQPLRELYERHLKDFR
ncbi:biotin-dependent carboxyltransferase family protein [Orrella sp. JC864]|uniref:5-oxoprolinase subunit C family protein n=1 Tax=Orrella sp. JC864 TaxID=3120298 RepID=UPI003009B2CB